MCKLVNKETRDNLNKVYKTTLGEKGDNIFTYTKFLTDSGYNEWDDNFTLMLIEYYGVNPLFDDYSLVLFDEKHSIIYGFKIEEESVIKYINSIKLSKYDIDNEFIESIPSLSKIGELHFKNKHYFDFIINKTKEQNEGNLNFCSEYFDYGSLFNQNNHIIDNNGLIDNNTTLTMEDYDRLLRTLRGPLYGNTNDNGNDYSVYDGYR